MALVDLLSNKKTEILERWRDLVFDSYAPETARFLKSQKDRFANPIAYQLTRGLTGILDVFLIEAETDQAVAQLDEVLRLKALQDASPSRALAFMFVLKTVIREELAQELQDPAYAAELTELESRIDGLALLGFDVYTQRREKLSDVKVAEIKRGVSALLRRLGLGDDYFEEQSSD
jgi:RsbT co-antagonist protein rsbRD N-terminal domain